VARTVVARHRILSPPVDIERIAAADGVRIIRRRALGALDARMRLDDGTWLIELNADRSSTAQRFSVGHELGHLNLKHDGCGTDAAQERQANVFAAELLMPLALIKAALKKEQSLSSLAARFEVSKEAITIKLNEQGLLLKLKRP
jgi:Zn-dependent peptidase ImmA (M78 family)